MGKRHNSIKKHLKKIYFKWRKTIFGFISQALLRSDPNFSSGNLKTLLIIAPPRIGDVAIISSIFSLLRTKLPESEINILANGYTSELLSFIKEINRIIVIGDSFFSKFKYVLSKARLKFDLAIDLNSDYHLWSAIVAGLNGDFSTGYDIDGRGFLFTKKLPAPSPEKHAIDVLCGPVIKLFSFDENIIPHLEVPTEIRTELDMTLAKIHISNNDRLIIIHPGAHHPTQRWLPEYFAETADNIIGYESKKLVFVGGPNERTLIEHIVSFMKKSPDGIFTDLGIKNLVGIIQRADLLICNNSGPLHIAVATNTPTISIMGPTIKERWEPRGKLHKVLRKDDLPCIGCNLGYCKIKTHDCMRLIHPTMVLDRLKDINLML